MRIAVPLILLFLGTRAGADPRVAPSAKVPSLHSVWSFPHAPTNANRKTGYWNIDARLIVDQEPGPTVTMFWAATFGIEGSGGGGYIGIQDGARRKDHSTGRIAIFSIWNATGASPGQGASCGTFAGEGTGYSCRVDYDWMPGDKYRLRVWAIPPAAWRGSILNERTGVETVLGDIRVPDTWGWLRASLDEFTENFGENSGTRYRACTDAPKTFAKFFAPTANDSQVNASSATGAVNTDANCTNVRSTITPDRSYAVEQMGADSPATNR